MGFALQRVSWARHEAHSRVARIATGTGALWVSRDEVENRAALFDSSMWKFSQEFDKSYPPGKPAPDALMVQWNTLYRDWYGDDDELKDEPDFNPGFYRKLKDKLIVGEAELNAVKLFEDRLKSVKASYVKYGNKTTIPDDVDPGKYESETTSWAFIKVLAVIGVGVYVLSIFAPAIIAHYAARRLPPP